MNFAIGKKFISQQTLFEAKTNALWKFLVCDKNINLTQVNRWIQDLVIKLDIIEWGRSFIAYFRKLGVDAECCKATVESFPTKAIP